MIDFLWGIQNNSKVKYMNHWWNRIFSLFNRFSPKPFIFQQSPILYFQFYQHTKHIIIYELIFHFLDILIHNFFHLYWLHHIYNLNKLPNIVFFVSFYLLKDIICYNIDYRELDLLSILSRIIKNRFFVLWLDQYHTWFYIFVYQVK